MSDRLNGKKHQIVNQPDLLLDEGLRISHSCKQTIMPCCGEGALPNVFLRNKEQAACRLIRILRAVGQQRLKTLLDEGCDVDDEGGADVGVEGGVENLVGAVWRAGK